MGSQSFSIFFDSFSSSLSSLYLFAFATVFNGGRCASAAILGSPLRPVPLLHVATSSRCCLFLTVTTYRYLFLTVAASYSFTVLTIYTMVIKVDALSALLTSLVSCKLSATS